MRFALAATALFAASASASVVFRRQVFPSCANTCVASTSPGSCAEGNDACLCKNTTYLTALAACFQKDCQGADLNAAEQTSAQYCLAAGVTVSGVPTGSSTKAASTSPAYTSSSVSASPTSNSTSAGFIVGINSFAGLAAFSLVALTL